MNERERQYFPDEEPEHESIHMGGWDYPAYRPTTILDKNFNFLYPKEEQRIKEMEEANGVPEGGINYPIRQLPTRHGSNS